MKREFSLEDIFVVSLGSAEKLKWFLQWNIDLVGYLDTKFVKYMALADIALAAIPKVRIRQMAEGITKEKILKTLWKERLDLWKIFQEDKRAMPWLDNQIENFRKRFVK